MTPIVGLLIVVAFLGAGLVLVIVGASRQVKMLRSEVQALGKRIERLQGSVESQERDMELLKIQLRKPKKDPLLDAMDGLLDLPRLGVWPTIGKVGLGLVRSYWRPKRTRASLPRADKQEKKQ
jgi:type II secretory pathway pseudopilin PulG